MESCLAGKPERVGPLKVEDIRKDLFQDFLQTQDNDNRNIKQQKEKCEKENLQVFLRVRPITSTESTKGESQDCVCLEGEETVVLRAPTYCLSSWHSDKTLPQTVQKFNFTKVRNVAVSHTFKIDKARRELGFCPKQHDLAESVEHYVRSQPLTSDPWSLSLSWMFPASPQTFILLLLLLLGLSLALMLLY